MTIGFSSWGVAILRRAVSVMPLVEGDWRVFRGKLERSVGPVSRP